MVGLGVLLQNEEREKNTKMNENYFFFTGNVGMFFTDEKGDKFNYFDCKFLCLKEIEWAGPNFFELFLNKCN